jgi:hypothetical protein
MAKWSLVVVPRTTEMLFPNLCPGCLKPQPETSLRICSDRGRMKAFYLVYSKWEYLRITVPFCKACARRRELWRSYDSWLVVIAALGSLVVSLSIVALLDLSPWLFWLIFFILALFSTFLCNRLVNDNRAVRIKAHNDGSIRFAFCHNEYARVFADLNCKDALLSSTVESYL